MDIKEFNHKLTAILNADVVSYSRLMREDEEGTVRTLTTYRNLISSLIERYRGRVVDSPGDNVLAEFNSVRDAVCCAVEIQREIRIRNTDLPDNRKMQFRVGINLGEVITEGNRIYGDGVNVAARIESLAEAGGICLSRPAYDQVKRKLEIKYDYLGEHYVKNIDEPVRVYKVFMDSVADEILKGERPSEIFKETGSCLQSEKPSIAVLPFVNISGDPGQEYFSDGITEELINALANVEDLKIISRTSSFFFKGKDLDLHTIGEKLNVDNVIEGSVRKAGNRLRITAQLIKVADDTHLWSETYNRELEDVFAIQEDIAKSIADSMKIRLFGKEKESFVKIRTENIDAYEAYIKGRYHYLSGDMEKALYYYKQAVEFDSGYAPAYSAIAEYYWHLSLTEHKYDVIPKAIEAINTALGIDNDLPEGHANLGLIKFFYEFDWDGAKKAFKTAIRLNPGLAKSHYDYALYLALRENVDDSILEARKAVELDPLSGISHYIAGVCLALSNQPDQAFRELSQAHEMMVTNLAVISSLTDIFMKKDLIEEAMIEINKGLRLFPNHPLLIIQLGNIYLTKGEKDKAREILHELSERSKKEYVSPMAIALLSAKLGEIDQAFEYIEQGYEKRDIYFGYIKSLFQSILDSDPRFDAFLKKIGF